MRAWSLLLLLAGACNASGSIHGKISEGDAGAEKPAKSGSPASDGGRATGGDPSDAGATSSPGGSGAAASGGKGGAGAGGKGGARSGSGGESTAGGSGGASGSGGTAAPPAPVPKGAIVGFGVNGQPRNWGSNGAAVKPALDMLVHDLGANFFRVEIAEGRSNWEQQNDDADPQHFEWSKYDAIFESKTFTDLFDYIRYLNQLGVPEITLSAHGLAPAWMGGEQIPQDKEDEFVEQLLAVMVYARTRAPEPRPRFTLISPWNETNVGPPEGIRLEADQGVRMLHKLVTRMDAFPELADVMVQTPDSSDPGAAGTWSEPLKNDAAVRARLRAVAFHHYGGYDGAGGWDEEPGVWLTEFNDWVSFCYVASWQNGINLAGNLLAALENGVKAGLVWTDYDAAHSHDNDNWESFGLLGASYRGDPDLCTKFNGGPSQAQLDELTYAPKPTYYAAKHAFRYIQRGAMRTGVSASGGAGLHAVAFKNPDGSTVVFGINTGGNGTFQVRLTDGTPPGSLVPWVSTDGSYHQKKAAVALANGSGSFALPGKSVFTLVGEP